MRNKDKGISNAPLFDLSLTAFAEISYKM
ncbi:hypothetical protein PLAN_40010 [Planktothrix rubescens CCAP 1459/22]|uniref:Uncharacterized protein n=1 Tax=Planktothrix rubescens CCAP 1459/22 TaxID=329571 RepID=A0A6J7ZHZ2_PLARU|nr:hypothetical protein PLAN_40010 [Planktothrix rubescens NIVA-CYA 18]CAD0227540.1 hypothetical protein PL10110_340035 [Planktothrix agardhii]